MDEKTVVAGNWKANGSLGQLEEWARDFDPGGSQAILCVPHAYLSHAARLLAGKAAVGAQDVAAHGFGAYTGNTTAKMVADCGASVTLVGHSERRAMGETDDLMRDKLAQAMDAGLAPIFCVGETLEKRQAGQLEQVLERQLQAALTGLENVSSMTIAYEPVWAIGTGVAASDDEAEQACELTRNLSEKLLVNARISVLYGGSVKPDNAAAYVGKPGIDGLLVGGASLQPDQFSQICAV